MPLVRLVYYSKYNMSSRGDALTKDLKQILATAIRTNSDRGISGGLIFNRRFFGQVLEGEHVAVTETFARISKDPRHKDVVIAGMEPVNERLFGAWSMGYAGNTELCAALCAKHGCPGGFDPTSMSGPDLIAFILALVTHEEKFASSPQIAAA